jgi:hypothetical protein
MTNTYTINKTTANSGTVTLNTGAGVAGSGGNVSIGGYGAIPPLTSSQIYTIGTGAGAGGLASFGGAGQIYTTTGTNGVNWATTSSSLDTVMKISQTNPPQLEVKGRMVINGVDLEERLSTIEKVLQIPERDVKLEKKHPKLKKLYDDYINALGKYRTFEAIKGEDE